MIIPRAEGKGIRGGEQEYRPYVRTETVTTVTEGEKVRVRHLAVIEGADILRPFLVNDRPTYGGAGIVGRGGGSGVGPSVTETVTTM